jgi:hypothetical protein
LSSSYAARADINARAAYNEAYREDIELHSSALVVRGCGFTGNFRRVIHLAPDGLKKALSAPYAQIVCHSTRPMARA